MDTRENLFNIKEYFATYIRNHLLFILFCAIVTLIVSGNLRKFRDQNLGTE